MRNLLKQYNELVFLLVGIVEAVILIKCFQDPYSRIYAYGFAFIFGVVTNFFTYSNLFDKSSGKKILILNILPALISFVPIILFQQIAILTPIIYLASFFIFRYLYLKGVKAKLLLSGALLLSISFFIYVALIFPKIQFNQKLIFSPLPESKDVANKLVLINFSGKTPIVFHGKITVIDFWATWCKPCIMQFDELELLREEYKSSSDVNIYALNTSFGHDSQNKVEKFVLKNKLAFDVLYDSAGTFSNTLLVDVLPTTIVIDSKGIIRYRTVGLNTSHKGFVKEITTVIDQLKKEETQNNLAIKWLQEPR